MSPSLGQRQEGAAVSPDGVLACRQPCPSPSTCGEDLGYAGGGHGEERLIGISLGTLHQGPLRPLLMRGSLGLCLPSGLDTRQIPGVSLPAHHMASVSPAIFWHLICSLLLRSIHFDFSLSRAVFPLVNLVSKSLPASWVPVPPPTCCISADVFVSLHPSPHF